MGLRQGGSRSTGLGAEEAVLSIRSKAVGWAAGRAAGRDQVGGRVCGVRPDGCPYDMPVN